MTSRIKKPTAIFLMIITAWFTYTCHADITTFLNALKPHYAFLGNLMLIGFISLCVYASGSLLWTFKEDWLRKNAWDLLLWTCLWGNLIIGCWNVSCGFSIGVVSWFLAYIMFLFLTSNHLERGGH